MDAAVYALLGTLIGALASSGTVYLQQRQQSRRDRLKMAVELAIQDYQHDLELAKASANSTGLTELVAPLDSYVICHAKLLDALVEGNLTKEKIEDLALLRNGILSDFSKKVRR